MIFLTLLNKIIWAVASSLILIIGFNLSFKMNFIQIKIVRIFKQLISDFKKDYLVVLFFSLAGRIGVGSIAGVALAIYYGGPGSLFWLFIVTFILSILSFFETVLASIYKVNDGSYNFGGPSFYIKKGLNSKRMGDFYALLVLVCYIIGFLGIQANTISKSFLGIASFSKYAVALILVIIVLFFFIGGVKKLTSCTNILVPIMMFFYLFLAFVVLVSNYDIIFSIFKQIFFNAFNGNSVKGGILGCFIIGMQRAIFSSEAGMGTTAISSASSSINPIANGYLQLIGVYITNFLICGSTAIFILTSDYQSLSLIDLNGIELIEYSFIYHFGNIGEIFVFIAIFLFAFSTIITGYYYGQSALKYLFNTEKMLLLKLISLAVIFLGAILNSSFLWGLVDILVAFLAIINVCSLFLLRKKVYLEYVNFIKKGK